MRRLGAVAVVCIVLNLPGAVASAEWVIDAEGDVVWEDNLSRAAREADRRSGFALAPSVSVGQHLQLLDSLRLDATASLRATVYPEYERLTHVAPTLTVGLRQKFGLGALAPWVRVFMAGGFLDCGDDVRDGALFETGLRAGKRLTERFGVEAGYAYESVDAGNDVFNSTAHTVSLEGAVDLTPALELSVRYAVRWGDLVVHRAPVAGAPRAPHTRLVDTFDTPFVASRIDATTHMFGLALSYGLTSNMAVGAGYEYQVSFGPIFDYPNHVVRTSFTLSF